MGKEILEWCWKTIAHYVQKIPIMALTLLASVNSMSTDEKGVRNDTGGKRTS